jgi:hypothetical protein
MSNLFNIPEEEKNRILNLHETATKNLYLMEQIVTNYDSKYDYKKEGNRYFFKLKNTNNWTNASGQPLDAIKTKVFKTDTNQDSNQSSSRDKSTPKLKTTGNDSNVNKNNIDIKNKEFFTQTKDTTGDTMRSFNQRNSKMIEDVKKSIELMGKVSEKTYKQLVSMMTKGSLKKDTFIVVNKDAAIASLFGPNYRFLGKSSITTGASKDTESFNMDEKTYKNWFIRSLEFFKKNPKHKDSVKINNWLNQVKKNTNIVQNDGSINYDDYVKEKKNKKISEFPFSYDSTAQLNLNVTPGGLYSIGDGYNVKGFAGGQKGEENSFPLINIKTGERLTPAIHGYAGDNRKNLIKTFDSQDVNISKDSSRAGSGCVNVDENFIKLMNKYNPKYVIIIPDYTQTVDVKIVTYETWEKKLLSLGGKCVRDLISFFT